LSSLPCRLDLVFALLPPLEVVDALGALVDTDIAELASFCNSFNVTSSSSS
jgi:hypothetical protein